MNQLICNLLRHVVAKSYPLDPHIIVGARRLIVNGHPHLLIVSGHPRLAGPSGHFLVIPTMGDHRRRTIATNRVHLTIVSNRRRLGISIACSDQSPLRSVRL